MHVGVSLPRAQFGADLAALRDLVQAAEGMGYSHIRLVDHVLGADPQKHPEVPYFPYTHESYLHEPLTLMGYLAAITTRLRLVTGMLVLPQRQTALVAKQAAEVDVLSGGRLRLGIGVGWNPVEFEAMGQDFHTRGRRCDEQIAVLRALWTNQVVAFRGQWHTISHAGINPLPVQRPIPIWIGVGSGRKPMPPEAALRRIGRLADGWFAIFPPDEAGRAAIQKVREYAKEAGRNPAAIGLEGHIQFKSDSDGWVAEAMAWKALGATHLALGMDALGPARPQERVQALERVRQALRGL